MREKAWAALEKGYKMSGDFEDLEWLSKVLLFGSGEEDALRRYLESKGRKPPAPKVDSAW